MYGPNRERDAELCGFKTITFETKKDAHQLVDGITTRALSEDDDARDTLAMWDEKAKAKDLFTELEFVSAFFAGIHAGSVAVARKWANAEAASAIGYWSGYGSRNGTVLLPRRSNNVVPFPEQ